ncbi:hypothetical protein PF004_g16395 [Phytophthora fragariae]|uniref:MABP domain-containing protein n=1 Tax=Phytophthora fragariae TaxID=53985 RepID=A0A6G0NIF7_9STRA|nr:hypothetical protein PF004_g16395 [Phytophthora fragariae]
METAATMDVVVVFQRNEYYVSTQASADRSTLPVDLLQCQLLSLVGVLPDDQVLLSPSGEVLYSPSKADVATIAVPTEGRPRFFLLSSAESTAKGRGVATDWTQICTKSTFGNAAVVQPAFRKIAPSGGDPLATLICGPCTRTCTTGFQPVSPMEWGASKKMASRFISEIAVVTGDVDVAAPAGFTKLPGDLNYSASGDYVYLCVKRGDPNALTQLHVLFYQLDGESSSAAERAKEKGVYIAEKVVDVDCNSGGTARDGSGMCVRIGYDSVQLLGNKEQLETFGITDITVVVGDQPPPSAEYVKITRNLNEGAPGALPVFICYRLAPLGGFACNSSREHSEFGECLFATRHVTGIECVLDFDEQRLCFARTTLAAARRRGDEAIMEAHYRQHQSGMLGRLQSGLQRAQSYESRKMQEEALKRIPVDVLHERAQANTSPMPSYQDELVKQLLHWFKREFFTWMNQPRCSACSHDKTRSVRTEGPSTAEEIAGQASRVEVYQCPACGALTRFPRYNDPVKLLDTRTGRCGEWANCFTLCCRAMGFEARYVLDVTDHVWTEVYSEHFKRWLHCDSCEDQLDCPLTYEVGWGKKLSYIFSFAHDEVVDTARRYTQNWAEMRSRRQDVSETWLETTIGNMNRSLRERQTPERVAVLTARAKSEQEELRLGRSAQKTEVKGRVSGSAEWKTQRQEDGKQEVASSNATSTPTLTKTLNAVSPADILQTICKNLVVGCQSAECSNPFCFTGRTGLSFSDLSPDVNERAAQALQLVTSLSAKGFSSDSLAMLDCTTTKELRGFLWKNQPLVYLPLQDPLSVSVTLIDISGNDNHAENVERCALRKPFRIPNSGHIAATNDTVQPENRTFGVQLREGKRLPISVRSGLPRDGFVLSFLVRLDQDNSVKSKQAGVVSVLDCELRASSLAKSACFRICWNRAEQHFSYEFQHGKESPTTDACVSSPLVFGHYAHIAIVRDETKVGMYVNGTKTTESELHVETFKIDEVTLEGPARDFSNVAAVISHVAVVPAKSADETLAFCAAMRENFVSAPPLRAFGPDGLRGDKTCAEAAAGAQSGYHVTRVLMWGGEFFYGLQFVYEKDTTGDAQSTSSTTVYGSLMGNATAKRQASQPTVTLELLPDEVVTRVSGRKGAWTDSITLHTNFGRTMTCGGNGGGDFSVSIPAKSEIRSISFKIGDHLTDAIAFVLEPSSTRTLGGDTMEILMKTLSSGDHSSRQKAISAALRYLENIAHQPEELKFKRIRASNKFFASNVGTLGEAAAKAFMRWCGFEEMSEQGEQFFVFQPAQQQVKPSPQRLSAEAHKRLHFLKNVGTH